MPLLANGDVCISVVRPVSPMAYWYRYAHGDEVIFVHEGSGVLESQFGTLKYGPGDYLVIPTGVMWRILPDDDVGHRMLVVECTGGHVEPQNATSTTTGSSLNMRRMRSATSVHRTSS